MIINHIYNVILNTQSDLSDLSYQTGVSNPWLPVVVALLPPRPISPTSMKIYGYLTRLWSEVGDMTITSPANIPDFYEDLWLPDKIMVRSRGYE